MTSEIRASVRELVEQWKAAGKLTTSVDCWLRSYDPEFSREMGRRGLLGITWPKEVGGGGQSGIARLVVTEELLRTGAPVAGHWIAERQIGPAVLHHGTDAAKAKFLPGIASGEMVICLGMSETEAGSDLAAVRTTATKVDGGWSITGSKVWTSMAHAATHSYVLARTEKTGKKHEGLSEFLVDMDQPGVEVRPIYDLAGEHHFNEMTFTNAFVPDEQVIGEIGQGWKQVTSQLSVERGGIERVLTTYPLFAAVVEELKARGLDDRTEAALTGKVLARYATLRAMAVRVALAIDEGKYPVTAAAVLKDLGTAFEKHVLEYAREVTEVQPENGAEGIPGLLAEGLVSSPGYTIRGGASEILKTVISRGIQEVLEEAGISREEVSEAADEILGDAAGEPDDQEELRGMLAEYGWYRVAVDEAAGGEGGSMAEAVEIVSALGRHGVAAPIAENIVATRALARAGRTGLDQLGVVTIADTAEVTLSGDTISGTAARVPWGSAADKVLVPVDGKWVLVDTKAEGVTIDAGKNLADEPRDTMTFSNAAAEVVGADEQLLTELSLFRGVATVGALETALKLSIEHVTTRHQFERPLIRFQAVSSMLAQLGAEFALAQVAVEEAVTAVVNEQADAASRVATLRVIADEAATLGARTAHQMHAAMGVTREHPLHLSTRRVWSWRDEVGTAKSWAVDIASQLVPGGEARVWDWITREDAN